MLGIAMSIWPSRKPRRPLADFVGSFIAKYYLAPCPDETIIHQCLTTNSVSLAVDHL
jgi:hypothetical protein